MRFLLLNQTFHPDVAASGQYLTEVARALAERGHQVLVVTSRRAYDQPEQLFPRAEIWQKIHILRVKNTGFGKTARWRRTADFLTFALLCCWRIILLPRADVVVALTSPPLISVLAACMARFWKSRFLYWVMDLNPDEAVAAGWMRAGSAPARLLERMSRFSLRRADRIIVPDRFMRERILSKGIGQDRLAMVAPWSQDDHVVFDLVGRKAFRKAHALERKFVVMYSGNHSPCHPLDTLLRAAQHLATDETITFCFIGGGSEWRGIQRAEHGLFQNPGINAALQRRSALTGNVKCLGYQPLEELKASLSAADLHVVILGEAMVGLVHPCKLYNILKVGAPILFIGPEPSHVSEILHRLSSEHAWCRAGHGDVVRVVDFIQLLSAATSEQPLRPVPELLGSEFSKRVLLPRLVAELEGQTPEGQKNAPFRAERKRPARLRRGQS